MQSTTLPLLFGLLMVLLLLFNGPQGFGYAIASATNALQPKGFSSLLFEKASKLFFQTKEEGEKFVKDILDQVKGEVGKLTSEIDKRLKAAEEQVQNGNKVDETVKEELKNLTKEHQNLITLVDGKLAEVKKLQTGSDSGKPKTLIKHLWDVFNEKDDTEGGKSVIERIKSGRKQPIEISLKAVGDLSASNLTGTYFAGYDLRPGIIGPVQEAHLRPLFNQVTTQKDTVRFARETTSEGGFGMVAAGAEKPQIDWDLQMYDAPVRKIAGYFRLPEEMIDDIPYLLSYLTTRGIEELQNTEDTQFVSGDGTGQNLTGLATAATAFAAGTLRVATPNYYDVLVTAKKQLRKLNLIPNYILVSPEDYAIMRLSKGVDGHYIFPVQPGTDLITVDGTPIIQNNRITDGTFFAVDTRWIDVVDRMAPQVRLFDQDRDNAIKNMVTCVIEERIAFPIYRPQAVVYGTFETAKAAITQS